MIDESNRNRMRDIVKSIFIIAFLYVCLPASAQTFKFALLTDIHISPTTTSLEDLQASIDNINGQDDIDFVLVTGDISENGDYQALLTAKNELDKLKVPYYAIPGNHETKWSESGVTDFGKLFGSDRFYFEYAGFAFIGFNTGPIIRMMDGHVAKQDLIWIKEQLDTHAAGKPIIVATHYPVLDGDVDNWYELTDLLRQYPVKAIVGGHYHRNQLVDYDGIPAFINRSNLRGKEANGGFSIYTVNQDSIVVAEQIVGKELIPWGGYALNKQYYTQDNSMYHRPDYSINQTFPEVKVKWKYELDAAVYASPLLYKKRVYVGDDAGKLTCFDVKTGQKIWQFKSDNRILGTPAADKNIVVFGSTDHYIYGIDAKTGGLLWKLQTDAAVIGAVNIHKGKAFIGCSDHKFRRIDVKTGKLEWSYDEVQGYVETKPLLYKNKVYFGAWDSHMYALNAKTGAFLWKWNNGNTRMHFSPAAVWPVGAKGKILFSAPDRVLTALDAASGKEIWRTKESMVRETIGLSKNNKQVYSKTMQDSVVCYSTVGEQAQKIWSVDVGYGYDHSPTMPLEKNAVVFCGTKNGLIFALDSRTGAVRWKHKIGNSIVNTLTPLSGKSCIFTTGEGYVGILEN